MVTTVFAGPTVGEKLKMVGMILKVSAESACGRIVPDGANTVILAVDALAGTVTRIVVLLEIVKSGALMPPKFTADAAIKFVPLRTTLVVGRPFVGEKLVSFGATK